MIAMQFSENTPNTSLGFRELLKLKFNKVVIIIQKDAV